MLTAEAIALFILQHPDLLVMLIDAIQGKKLTAAQANEALRTAMIAAADAQMKAELGASS